MQRIGFTALFLCFLNGCSTDRAQPDAARPNIVLITLDTVRADHVGCYGYARPLTPVLDGLAARATRFAQARASSPWTLPSHASIFTGLYPYQHGAHTVWIDLPESFGAGSGESASPPRDLLDNVQPLPESQPTLAEILKRAGYQTAAIGANDLYLHARYGLGRGFEHYDIEREFVDALNRRVARWLRKRDDRPFFLFINYMDAHIPYNPSPRPDLFEEPVPRDSSGVMDQLYPRILQGDPPVPEPLLELIVKQYDRGIANLDAGLGQLFGLFRKLRLYDDLLLVVTSDHGEYFGEHQLIAHSKDVYEPVMRVPLIIKEPRQSEGSVRDEAVSLVHLPSLILSRVEAVDPSQFPHAARLADGVVLAENYYTRWKDLLKPWGLRFHRVRRVVYRGNLKYIDSSDGRHELYDLAADPREAVNLVASRAGVAVQMSEELHLRLAAWSYVARDEEPRELTEEEIRRLEALGYL